MKKIFAGILMTVLLTGCSSQEILSEVPQTIVLPEEQIDSLPMQEEDPTSAETENTESFSLLEEGGSRFAYESLEAPDQIWYLEIEQALGEMEDTVKLSTDPLEQGLDEQDIDKIFQCVMIDHPEIFYATGYTYTKYSRGEKTVGIDFAGSYELTKEEAIVRAEKIRKVTADWIRGIGEDKSEYEKVKAVYEQIIFATDYDLNAPDNQNICSVFLEGASVCQGYAKATQYLLNHLGVMCTLVQGTVDTGEAHAWNLVRVDGDYYYVDTTWGDASYRMEDGRLWAGMGRAANNLGAVITGVASVSLLTGENHILTAVLALVLFVLISVALLWYYSCTQIVKAPEGMESREMSGSQSRLERFAKYFDLTEREQEVLQLLLLSDDGMQEIADSLFVSRAMLYRHVSALNEKTGTRSRIGLIQFYYNWEEDKK